MLLSDNGYNMTTLALSHNRQSMSDLAQLRDTLHYARQYLRLALSARTELKESFIVRAYSWLQDQSCMLRFLLFSIVSQRTGHV